MNDKFSFYVCTYNSSKTLDDCLKSIKEVSNGSRSIVVDHDSRRPKNTMYFPDILPEVSRWIREPTALAETEEAA